MVPSAACEIEGICNRALLDGADLEQRAKAEKVYERLTSDQKYLLELGATARTFVISSPNKDRHRTVFVPGGWDLASYRENPVVLYGHDQRAFPIGISNGAAIGSDEKMRSTVVLLPASEDERAAKIDRLIELKVVKGASVGAIPREVAFVEDDKGDWWVEYRKTELVEWSIVALPSNRDSLVEAVRAAVSEGLSAEQARNFLSTVCREGMGELEDGVVSHVAGAPHADDPWRPYKSLFT